MKKFITSVVCVLAMFVSADERTLKPGVDGIDFDWNDGANYEGGVAPQGGDVVVIPEGVSAKVTAGDNASFALVNSLYRITPKSGAKLVVSVTEGAAELACTVCGIRSASQPDSTLEKTGAGTLTLSSVNKIVAGSYCLDYGVNMTVTEGILQLPQNRASGKPLFTGTVTVSDSAEFVLSTPSAYSVYLAGLSGAGTVSYKGMDGDEGVITLYLGKVDGSEKTVFSGKMTGAIKFFVSGSVDLTGAESDFSGSPIVAGRLGIGNFGTYLKKSSLGIGNVNFSETEGIVECVGTEPQETDKRFWWKPFATLDAGSYGGVTFKGKFSPVTSEMETYYVIHLTGSNTTECVIANAFISTSDDEGKVLGTPCVCKTGSGTWRMAAGNKGMHGVIHVADGTLKFDSIAKSGMDCSVGYADCLRECTPGTLAGLPEVGYAFLLGGDSTTGTLEYSGTDAAGNATRPIAVKSNGRFVSSSAEFRLQDVYALGTGEKTIALAGDSDKEDLATGFSDGTDGGRLSVVKEGDGEWKLWGTNTFTGSVSAKGGRLVVWNPEKRYTWFRFTVMENGYGRPGFDLTDSLGAGITPSDYEKGGVQITEIELYDAEGVNIAAGITMDTESYLFDPDDGYRGLKEGHVGCGVLSGVNFQGSLENDNWRTLANLFNSKSLQMNYKRAQGTGVVIGDDSTWFPIVFRLPASEKRVAVAMDVVSGAKGSGLESYCGRNITAFRFEGSTDGVNWDSLFEKKDIQLPEAASYFYSDPEKQYKAGVVRKDEGYGLIRTEPAEKIHRHAFTGVGAANGGVLEVVGETYTASTLVIDASGTAGEIRNVVFAENGFVNVENLESMDFDSLELPGDFSEVLGYANLAGWGLMVDGEECIHKVLTESNGKLTLRALGLKIIIR